MKVAFKDKARADEKTQHTRQYVSILKRLATPQRPIRTWKRMKKHQFREDLYFRLNVTTMNHASS
jgi:transcriptional regulator with PAS, ATPase and Fis domain